MHRLKSSPCPFEGIIRQISFVVVVGLLSVSIALGQTVGGRVSGRSTDPSGAVVPGVRISAQNTSTNVESGTQSDGSGYYALQLPSGNYTITASATGFGTLVQQNVTVTVGGDVGLDFHLDVASSTTSVEVHGEGSPLINPNTSSVQTSVDNSLVSTIPVAISGSMRNASSFLQLEPGYNSTALSLNGGAFGDQPVTVDGANVSAVGFGSGQGSASWAAIVPSFAVQEFQVVGSNPDADVGRTSTGAIKYVLKSGTNQLHGSVFEYLKNTVVDARSFFRLQRGVDHQNEFGFELGGPIKRNKTFFYGYYDGFRYATSNTGVFYSLLTPAMKAGDFTAAGIPAIYDPSTTVSNASGGFTRQQFSCNGVLNKICPGAISPVSAYFASLFPNPTLPGLTNNFQGTTTSDSTTNELLLKMDQVLSPTSRLSVSASWEGELNLSNCTFGPALCGGSYSPYTGSRAIINWDKTLSPNKLNHVLVSVNRLSFDSKTGQVTSLSEGTNLNGKAGLGFVNQTGLATISAGYYLGGGSGINRISHTVYSLGDDFTWIHGSHQMQFGFNGTRYYTIGQQGGRTFPYGSFQFSPLESGLPGNSKTGYAAASFLLGQADVGTFGQYPGQAWVMPYYGIYAHDKWKIRSNLTFTYGLRWDYSSPITDRQDRIANFDPTLPNPGAGNILGALTFAGNGPGRDGQKQFANGWFWGFGPRLGLAYAWKPGTVLRAAYGLMYDTNNTPAPRFNQQGFIANDTIQSLNGGVTPAFNWNSGFPVIPLGPYFDPTFANDGSTSWMTRNGAREPAIENYNVGIQQKLWAGIVLDASYVGTQGHHLYNGGLNPNQLDPRYLALGTILQSTIGSAQAVAAGIKAPYTGFVGTVAQALRPYPQYQTITITSDPVGNQHYNALQVRAQKTLSQGFSMLISYTYSKNITDVNNNGTSVGNSVLAQNYYNLAAERAVATFDLPQSFVASYTYDLPLGKGKLLKLSNKVADKLLGGWTTAGVITLQSGTPISVTTELSLPAIGSILPNVVPGQPLYGPHDTRGSFDPSVDKYINLSAFTSPPAFSFGTAPRYFDSLRTFGMRSWNAALMKKFPLTERISLNFKGEFFNVLNTVNFGAPNSDIQSASFGKITTINGNPRQGQVSATVSW